MIKNLMLSLLIMLACSANALGSVDGEGSNQLTPLTFMQGIVGDWTDASQDSGMTFQMFDASSFNTMGSLQVTPTQEAQIAFLYRYEDGKLNRIAGFSGNIKIPIEIKELTPTKFTMIEAFGSGYSLTSIEQIAPNQIRFQTGIVSDPHSPSGLKEWIFRKK